MAASMSSMLPVKRTVTDTVTSFPDRLITSTIALPS
jgi:hypothetical protein